MATVSFNRLHQLQISVNQIQENPEYQFYPSPTSVQLELTITLQQKLARHNCSIGHVTELSPFVSHETLRFDLHVLENQHQANRLLAPMMRRLGIARNVALVPLVNVPRVPVLSVVINKIISRGLEIANMECNRGRIVLFLHTEVTLMIVRHVHRHATFRPLAWETRRNDIGMIPATCLSINEMVKSFRVEEGDQEVGQDCNICLEEFIGNSVLSRMPCSHIFHAPCIERWLNNNHYCPLCRYKMPTYTD